MPVDLDYHRPMIRRALLVMVPCSALLACLQGGGQAWSSPHGGGGAAPAAPAAFYCNSGGYCASSHDACAHGGVQIGGGFETACTASDVAWCAHADRTACTLDEGACASSYQTHCDRYQGLPSPPPPPPPVHDHLDVLAVLVTTTADPAPRPIFCRYVAGALDPAGPAALCPAGAGDFRAAAVPASGWTLRVLVDAHLDERIVTRTCVGDACTTRLNAGVVALTCDGAAVATSGTYDPAGDHASDPVGPALTISPDPGATIAPGATCMVTLSDWVTDPAGAQVPADQRAVAFSIAAP